MGQFGKMEFTGGILLKQKEEKTGCTRLKN
jgi:hypothetical protein